MSMLCNCYQRWHRHCTCYKSWLTPMDSVMCCSYHTQSSSLSMWLSVWRTGDGRRSTVDKTRWQSACHRKIILSSEVGEKLQRELRLCLEIFKLYICLINILQLQGALSQRPEALDPMEAWPQTICIGSKYRACNDCIDLPTWSKLVNKYLFICKYQRTHSNKNKSRNKSTSAKISHLIRHALGEWPSGMLEVITIAKHY